LWYNSIEPETWLAGLFPLFNPWQQRNTMDTLYIWMPRIIVLVIAALVVLSIYNKGFKGFFTSMGANWNLIAASGAWVLLGVGYTMPTFRAVMTLPLDEKLKGGIAILAVVGAVWAIFDIVSKFLVSSKAVLFGIMLYTAFNAMLFTGLAWSFHASGELRTFMVAPALYSGMLLFAGILAGVQNAWQKNPTQIQRGGGE
jgi:hypothetical protein